MIEMFEGATIPDVIVFVIGSAMVLLGALGVVTAKHPIRATLSLVVSLFGVAVLFVEQRADFLAAVQIIVYAGAIVVLFLFVIMLLGVDRMEPMSANRVRLAQLLGVLAALGVFSFLLLLARGTWRQVGQSSQGGALDGEGSNVAKLSRSIFTDYVFLFETTSLLLVIAVVGAVVLARTPLVPLDEGETPRTNPRGSASQDVAGQDVATQETTAQGGELDEH